MKVDGAHDDDLHPIHRMDVTIQFELRYGRPLDLIIEIATRDTIARTNDATALEQTRIAYAVRNRGKAWH